MPGKQSRGFAAMDPEKQRMIASKGGKAAHAKGTAHEFTPEEARAAGRKGGQAAHAKGTAHQFTPEEARAAGRKGGQNAHQRAMSGAAQTSRSLGSNGVIEPEPPSFNDERRSEIRPLNDERMEPMHGSFPQPQPVEPSQVF